VQPYCTRFSLEAKRWRKWLLQTGGLPNHAPVEFAVAEIGDICWNPEPFDQLAIPKDKKEMIRAVALSHVNDDTDCFDNFVRGKG
jgi:hypothetical protein